MPPASAAPASPFDRAPGAFPAQDSNECLTDNFRDYASVEGAHVRVWFRPGSAVGSKDANRIVSEIELAIWPKFVALLGREPPTDENEACFHGPDGKLDVYLTTARQIGTLKLPDALTHPFARDPTCAPEKPVFIVAHPGVQRSVIAHELFHAFQAAYRRAQRCILYSDWEEATATWAADHVYPRDNLEHVHKAGLDRPKLPIDFYPGYPAWVFPYYLTRKYDDPSIVRQIEEAGEGLPHGEHVDRSIPGGFKERFPEFALFAWNQRPLPRTDKIKDSFRQWDGVRSAPQANERELELGRRRSRALPWKAAISPLARDYRRYAVADGNIRLVRFENPQARELFGVGAFVRLKKGGWQAQDWTRRSSVEFCRDLPKGDLREVVIALANSNHNRGLRAQPKLVLRNKCKYPVTFDVVSVSGTFEGYVDDPNSEDVSCDTHYEAHWTTQFDPRWRATAKLDILHRDSRDRPVFTFGSSPPGIPVVHQLGSARVYQDNCDPGITPTSCKLDPREDRSTIALGTGTQEGSATSLPLDWYYGYPSYSDYDCGGFTAFGFAPSPGLDVHPLNEVNNSTRRESPSTFGGDTLTLTHSGSDTGRPGYRASYSMSVTLQRR